MLSYTIIVYFRRLTTFCDYNLQIISIIQFIHILNINIFMLIYGRSSHCARITVVCMIDYMKMIQIRCASIL